MIPKEASCITESPSAITRNGSAGEGACESTMGFCPSKPPAPGTDAACSTGRRVVRTTTAGSATAGKVATTISTAVSTPASGAPRYRTHPCNRARRIGRSTQ